MIITHAVIHSKSDPLSRKKPVAHESSHLSADRDWLKVQQRSQHQHHSCLQCVCVCVCVCGHVYVVYEDTNLYNDMGMT